MTLQIGRKAPDFSIETFENGRFGEFKLSDNADQWTLLWFYPGDFTFVCPTELTAMAKLSRRFKELNTRILAVSVDSKFVHLAWHDSELSKMAGGGLPFPLGSDMSGHVGQLYNVYDDQARVDNRGTFIIDPDGNLQAMEIVCEPLGRNFEESLRQLEALHMIRESGGANAAPCGWQKGGKTLRPGADLVGHVHEVMAG